MEELQINWMAFATAVVAQMIVGYLWFHPAVMGKIWARSLGKTYEDLTPKNPAVTYGIAFLLTLLFTMFLVANVTGPGQEDLKFHTFQHGIVHAITLALMILLPVFGTPALFEKRDWRWVLVHVGYWFCRIGVAAGILSYWR